MGAPARGTSTGEGTLTADANPACAITVRVRELFARTGRWTGSRLRRHRGWAHLGERRVPLETALVLDGRWQRLEFEGVVIEARAALPPLVLLDKPVGAVTSRRNEHGAPTVFDGLPHALRSRVHPVGRLDRATSGLLLLTADGGVVQRLTHPKRAVPRVYRAVLQGQPDEAALAALREGELALADGHRPRPTGIEPVEEGVWDVVLTEGKYHEVRRLFAAAGAHVTELRRIAYGDFRLEDLRGAHLRRLDDAEVAAAYARMGLPSPPAEPDVREVDPGAG